MGFLWKSPVLMIGTGACHDIILSDYLALSLAIPPPVKRPVAPCQQFVMNKNRQEISIMYDNDNDLVLYESIWTRKQTIFNPVVN
jgi:hypothetical protein